MQTEKQTQHLRDPAVAASADAHLSEHQMSIWVKTDRLFAALLASEWVACVVLSAWLSPSTWSGPVRGVHPHVWTSALLGGATIALPVAMALLRAGRAETRHVIAVAQMLMSALLIHVGGGRIEMHFHIFGSLAFLAFYRDWRVLITGSAVVALDHLGRGLFLPQSVYGVASPTIWRTLEHAGWVVFEDIFLIFSCVQGTTEMRKIAENRALLERSHGLVEREVRQRTEELRSTQEDLMKAARTAGMAEIATSVLHNVGNVLNSVNISAKVVAETLQQSEVGTLGQLSDLLEKNQGNLGAFMTEDEQGRQIPGFVAELASCLAGEQGRILSEVKVMSDGIEHIKQIVAAQQSAAKTSNVRTPVSPSKLLDTAITLQGASLGPDVTVERECGEMEDLRIDNHKVLQILINLLGNAGQAVRQLPKGEKRVSAGAEIVRLDAGGLEGEVVRFRVSDNGAGIPRENLSRIFSHGFTTKRDGHGFGLHSAANAAREMGGSISAESDGVNRGATFILDIPVSRDTEKTACDLQPTRAGF